MTSRRLPAALVALGVAVLGAAPEALACPQCAGRSDGPGVYVALGAMILLPFAVVAVVGPIVRRGPPESRV